MAKNAHRLVCTFQGAFEDLNRFELFLGLNVNVLSQRTMASKKFLSVIKLRLELGGKSCYMQTFMS
mgnify:CR=1 FL=1